MRMNDQCLLERRIGAISTSIGRQMTPGYISAL